VSVSEQLGYQPIYKVTPRIDWRKLLLPFLFIMVLPSIAAFALDVWLGTLPFITIVAILICFPIATIWVTRVALKEMDRVIAEVAPPLTPESDLPAAESGANAP
jgi:hypothetical protein